MPDYNIHRDFNLLFLNKEQKELYGRGYKNFIYLGLILLITFLVLGFASGSLKYLKMKMDDPFIKWISVEIPYEKADRIPQIAQELNSRMMSDSFNIEEINGYFQYTMFFLREEGPRQFQAMGRTIRHDDRILARIADRKNLLEGQVAFGEQDIGLIVTRELLDQLGYGRAPSHISMSYPVKLGIYAPAPVPVVAVVRQLPGRSHFVTTPYFFNKRLYSQFRPFDVLDDSYARTLELFCAGDREDAARAGGEIMPVLESNPQWREAFVDMTVQDYDRSFQPGKLIRLVFSQEWASHERLDEIVERIRAEPSLGERLTRVYSYNLSGVEPPRLKYDYLSVYFSNLDRIREFQDHMERNYELRIDMTQIEAKENYNFVSKLTLIISIFLIGFSILSIVFFIINLLKSHIAKIRKNLGTFKAFGLNNTALFRIYIFMALRFLTIASVIAFFVSLALGNLGVIRLVLSLFINTLEENQDYFDLLNWVSYATIPMIIILNGVIVRYSLAGILSRSPGDLIYSRD